MESIAVLIVEEHRVYAEALAARLAAEDDVGVVRVVPPDCLAGFDGPAPDLLLVGAGWDWPRPGLMRFLAQRWPGVPILVMSCLAEDSGRAATALRGGAAGWVSKNVSSDEIVLAAKLTSRGVAFVPGDLRAAIRRELERWDWLSGPDAGPESQSHGLKAGVDL